MRPPKVNVVLVVDSSLSIVESDWILEQQFAKDTVAAFASRNIFDNGGTASYVQFSSSTSDEGTFNSTESFDEHVDSVIQYEWYTNIAGGTHYLQFQIAARPKLLEWDVADMELFDLVLVSPLEAINLNSQHNRSPHVPTAGIIAGRALLNENPASFGFMVLITDGENTHADPSTAAQETRADNTTTIFAVGVGMPCPFVESS